MNKLGFLENSPWVTQMQDLWGLFIVSTPLGHSEDITLRGLVTLALAHGILCEDTRVVSKLLTLYNIPSKPCYPYHQHNEGKRLPWVLEHLKYPQRMALVSDRGTPLISDPGGLLVAACHREGIPVHGIPGPCSAVLGVVLSGFSCKNFYFHGFLDPAMTQKHWEALAQRQETLIIFEAPHRLLKTFEKLCAFFQQRRVCVLRELTKKFEERQEGLVEEVFERVKKKAMVRGEYVLVLEGKISSTVPLPLDQVDGLLEPFLPGPFPKEALISLTQETLWSKRCLYQRYLTLKQGVTNP